MNLKIMQDTSLFAQALQAQQGYISYYVSDVASFSLVENGPALTIVNLYIIPSMRRQGIGTRLFEHIEAEAREAGFSLLGLSVVTNRPDSGGAVAFAQSLGLRFSEAGSGPELNGYFKPLKAVLYPISNAVNSSDQSSEAQV